MTRSSFKYSKYIAINIIMLARIVALRQTNKNTGDCVNSEAVK